MEKRKLGNTELEITPIGFGAWALGGHDWEFGWGKQDDNLSIAAIHKALELGINWIDTAAVYGLGHSEEIVAKALKNTAVKPYVFTKCELVWDNNRKISGCLKAGSIRKECEASLKRLQTDVIDLYQIHWPNPEEDIEEGWETLAKLKDEGKVRYTGVSNFNTEQMKRIQKHSPISTLQPPYSMLRRNIESDILPFCEQNNIGTIVYSPMLSGLLTGKMTKERALNLPLEDWRRKNKEFSEPNLSHNLELVEKLRTIGNRHNVSSGVVAIAWTLRLSSVTAAIVGGRSPEQVEETSKALEFRLNDDEIDEIEGYLGSL